jgi:hypothetical protein
MLFKKCANISVSFQDQHVLEFPQLFPNPSVSRDEILFKGVGFVTPGNFITIKYF